MRFCRYSAPGTGSAERCDVHEEVSNQRTQWGSRLISLPSEETISHAIHFPIGGCREHPEMIAQHRTTEPHIRGEGTPRVAQAGRLARIVHWEPLAQRALYRASELARLCDVSLRHLQRHFRRTFNSALTSWLNDLRLRQARERLQAGWRVNDVAYSLGYKQVSHFSRVFRQHYGLTPSAVQTLGPIGVLPRGSAMQPEQIPCESSCKTVEIRNPVLKDPAKRWETSSLEPASDTADAIH